MKSIRNRRHSRIIARRKLALEPLQARELFAVDSLIIQDSLLFEIAPSSDVQLLNVIAREASPNKITQVAISRNGVETQISEDGESILYRLPSNPQPTDSIEYVLGDSIHRTLRISNPNTGVDSFDIVSNQPQTKLDVLRNDDLRKMTGKITRVLDLKDGDNATIAADGRSILYSTTASDYSLQTLRYVVDDLLEGTIQISVHSAVKNDNANVISNSRDFPVTVLSNDEYVDYYTPGSSSVHRIVSRITGVSNPIQGGTVRVSDDGTYIYYTAPSNFQGVDSFEYVADGKFTAKVQVTVSKPVFDDYFNVLVDQENVVLNVLGNDFPGGGDGTETRVISSTTQPKHGQLRIAQDGSYVEYSPSPGYLGGDSFEYIVGDFRAKVSVGVVPMANDDYLYLDYNNLQELDVLLNDGGKWYFRDDSISPNLTITSVSASQAGANLQISADGKKLLYSGGSGSDRFTYTVNNKYTANVSVYYTNWLQYDFYLVDENSGEKNLAVLSNDFVWPQYRNGQAVSYQGQRKITAVSLVNSSSTVRISPDGSSIFYTPAKDFFGSETVQYEVDGFLKAEATIRVVRYTRDDQFRVAAGSEQSVLPVLLNDSLAALGSTSLRITKVSASSAGSQLTISTDGQAIVYTPPPGFVGIDRFTYYVDHKQTASVEVTVQPDNSSTLSRFAKMSDFRDWLLSNAVRDYQYQFGQAQFSMYSGFGVMNLSLAADRSYSQTNVQVVGVDEADLIENDGEHLFMMRGHELIIARAYPSDSMSILSRVAVPGIAVGMYLNGSRLSIVSREQLNFPPEGDWFLRSSSYFGYTSTIVSVFDVSDTSQPTLVQRTKITGTDYTDSRRIGNELYMVMSSPSFNLPGPMMITDSDDVTRYEDEEAYVKRIKESFGSIIEDVLPRYQTFDGSGNLVRGGVLIQPEDIFLPRNSLDRQLLSILRFDMASNSPGVDQVLGAITGSNVVIYASADNLYVFDYQQSDEQTVVRKFAWTKQQVSFQAVGIVPGKIVGQFSADERFGALRLVTTVTMPNTQNPDQALVENAFYILRQEGDLLEIVGANQYLPAGASINGVRFSEDRAIVNSSSFTGGPVIVDLSQAEAPKILGAAAITGYDDYLQFIDDGVLLSIGTNTSGGDGSIMVTMYDASNLQQLKILGQYAMHVSAGSIASMDHHAFGWFKELGLLTIPIRSYPQARVDLDMDGYKEAILTKALIELVALRIDPTAGRQQSVKVVGRYETQDDIHRSAFIDNNLYIFTAGSLIAIDASDIHELDKLEFGQPLEYTDSSSSTSTVTALQQKVREHFADELGVNNGEVQFVSFEPVQGARTAEYSIVARFGDQFKLCTSNSSSITSSQADFVFGSNQWQNLDNPLDINGDQRITPSDALVAINYLNEYGPHQLGSNNPLHAINSRSSHPLIDSNGDGYAAPSDALEIINYLNAIREPAQFAAFMDDVDVKRRAKVVTNWGASL
ncbi:MAG: beta-propeller domain-containing protein [Pirellulales bacterium]